MKVTKSFIFMNFNWQDNKGGWLHTETMGHLHHCKRRRDFSGKLYFLYFYSFFSSGLLGSTYVANIFSSLSCRCMYTSYIFLIIYFNDYRPVWPYDINKRCMNVATINSFRSILLLFKVNVTEYLKRLGIYYMFFMFNMSIISNRDVPIPMVLHWINVKNFNRSWIFVTAGNKVYLLYLMHASLGFI